MVGFRGCDGEFAESLEAVRRDTGGFGKFVNAIVKAAKDREKRIAENVGDLLNQYGTKYCPFHSEVLVEGVREDSTKISVGGKDYSFNSAVCSRWKMCETPISFDEGLVKKVSKFKIREVELEESNACTTCGDTEGRGYLVGFRSPIYSETNLLRRREFANEAPVYLIERSCGHNYVMVQSFIAPNLKVKESDQNKPERGIAGKIYLAR